MYDYEDKSNSNEDLWGSLCRATAHRAGCSKRRSTNGRGVSPPMAVVMSVAVDPTGDAFSVGEPELLFRAGPASFSEYDVDMINDRFLVLEQIVQDSPISLYLNWKNALEVR